MKERQGDYIKFIFLTVVFLLLGLAIYFGYRKEGYYIDELWSYGLANSYETPFLQKKADYMEVWHHPDFYKEYLTVEPGRAFAWESVYDNQVQDVHPPFYFFLLHGISSFFPGKFSKWYGLSINLLFYAATLFLLFELGGIWDNGEKSSIRLLVPLLYGVSVGALSNAVYIRMYMMVTCAAVLFAVLVWHAMIKEGAGHRKKACVKEPAQIYICFLALSVCGYFLLVVQISTDIVSRYQFLIYPFIWLLLVYPVAEVCRFFRKEYLIWILAAGYVFFCLYSYGTGNGTVTGLYPGYGDTLRAMETEYKNVPGIYVTKGDHLVIGNCLFLSKQELTYALPAEGLPVLHEKLELPEVKLLCESEDRLILYVDIYYQEQSTAEEVCRLLGYRKVEHLYDNQFTQIYVLEK